MICIHPTVHAVLPFPDSFNFHRLKSLGHIFFQGLEGVITVFGEVPLDSAPEELNEIEFTMELGQKMQQWPAASMTS